MTSIHLAELHRQELRADATRVRLVAEASRARRDRRPSWQRRRSDGLWPRRRRATAQPAATVLAVPQQSPLGDLAHRLAAHGPSALEDELDGFVARARAGDATPLLLSILADSDQPDIARQRAFGRIVAELENPQPSTARRGPDVAAA